MEQTGSQQLQASVGAASLGHSSEMGSNCSTPGMLSNSNCCPPTPQHQLASPFDEAQAQANRNRSLSHSLNYSLVNFPPHTPSPAAYALRASEPFTPPALTPQPQLQSQSHAEPPPGLWPPAGARHMSLSSLPPQTPHGNSLNFGAFPQSAPYHSALCAFPPSSPRHQIIRLPAAFGPPGFPAPPGDHQSPASFAVDNVTNNAFVPAAAAGVESIAATSHPSPFNHTGLLTNGPVAAAAAAHLAHSSPPPLGAPGVLPAVHRALHPSLAYSMPAQQQQPHLPYAQAGLASPDATLFSPVSEHQTQPLQQPQMPHQFWPPTVLSRHLSVPSATPVPVFNSVPQGGPTPNQVPMTMSANAQATLVVTGAPGVGVYAAASNNAFQPSQQQQQQMLLRPGLQVLPPMHLPHDAPAVSNNVNVRGPSPAIPQLDGVDDSFTESTSEPKPNDETVSAPPPPQFVSQAIVVTQAATQQALHVPFSSAQSAPETSTILTFTSNLTAASATNVAFHPGASVFLRPVFSSSSAVPASPLNVLPPHPSSSSSSSATASVASSAQSLVPQSQLPPTFAPKLLAHPQQPAPPSALLEQLSQSTPPLAQTPQPQQPSPASMPSSATARSRPPSVPHPQALTAVQQLEAPSSSARERAASSSSVSQLQHSAPHSRHTSGSGSGVAAGVIPFGASASLALQPGVSEPVTAAMPKPLPLSLTQSCSLSSSLSSLQQLVPAPPAADAPLFSSASPSAAHSKTPMHSGITDWLIIITVCPVQYLCHLAFLSAVCTRSEHNIRISVNWKRIQTILINIKQLVNTQQQHY